MDNSIILIQQHNYSYTHLVWIIVHLFSKVIRKFLKDCGINLNKIFNGNYTININRHGFLTKYFFSDEKSLIFHWRFNWKEFFNTHSSIIYWRFQVIYSFKSKTIEKTCDIAMNDRARNGFCPIQPPNGIFLLWFPIDCSNWFDDDEFFLCFIIYWELICFSLCYSMEKWNLSSNDLFIIKKINLRLPASISSTSKRIILVYIRDTVNCLTEFSLSSISIHQNLSIRNNSINKFYEYLSN